MYDKTFSYNRKIRQTVVCGNCGDYGHIYRKCPKPITSLGILAMRRSNLDLLPEYAQEQLKSVGYKYLSPPPGIAPLRFLLVERKDTMGYIDCIRGHYPDNPDAADPLLHIFFEDMTPLERERIGTLSFEQLWDLLWLNHNYKCYISERDYAFEKFQSLDVAKYLQETVHHRTFTEWGIPKGRRNMKENNLECAEREFREETGYAAGDYTLLSNIKPLEEEFIGSNNVAYKHIYYLAIINDTAPTPKVDSNNRSQLSEISHVTMFTHSECMSILRPRDIEKKAVITRAYNHFRDKI